MSNVSLSRSSYSARVGERRQELSTGLKQGDCLVHWAALAHRERLTRRGTTNRPTSSRMNSPPFRPLMLVRNFFYRLNARDFRAGVAAAAMSLGRAPRVDGARIQGVSSVLTTVRRNLLRRPLASNPPPDAARFAEVSLRISMLRRRRHRNHWPRPDPIQYSANPFTGRAPMSVNTVSTVLVPSVMSVTALSA